MKLKLIEDHLLSFSLLCFCFRICIYTQKHICFHDVCTYGGFSQLETSTGGSGFAIKKTQDPTRDPNDSWPFMLTKQISVSFLIWKSEKKQLNKAENTNIFYQLFHCNIEDWKFFKPWIFRCIIFPLFVGHGSGSMMQCCFFSHRDGHWCQVGEMFQRLRVPWCHDRVYRCKIPPTWNHWKKAGRVLFFSHDLFHHSLSI